MESNKCDELIWCNLDNLASPFINYQGAFLENKFITTYDCLSQDSYQKVN